ncbi:MAG: SH3 domain-containing protein [Thermoanaerobaculia bacterium]|nr:SH3 domain-containing protein [Thermoanaerobaculia bacterium]
MGRIVAAVVALTVASLGLLLILPLYAPSPPPASHIDPLARLSTSAGPRPLTRAQLLALERYGHPSGPAAGSGSPAPQPPAPRAARALDRRVVAAGEALRTSPQSSAAILATVAATAQVPVLSERDGWALVSSGETTGWVETRRLVRLGEPVSEEPPLGDATEPTLPLAAVPADPARLARARAHLDLARTRTFRLGPWTLLTDVEDTAVLAQLDRVARRIEDSYRARFGVTPVGEARETVVLFAREASYRAFRRSEGAATSERVAGHATVGLAALVLGDRGGEATAESLVHELTHLLNRRAIGPALPPWLDEGLANDLALCRLTPEGRLELGTLSSRRRPAGGNEVTIEGGEALALVARRRLGRLVPLEDLLHLGPAEFLTPAANELHYAESALFVRYLLESTHREPFLAFLRAVSEGAPIDPEAFRVHLGPSWHQLQASFETWLGFAVSP